MGYSPLGCKESDTTERIHFHFLCARHISSEYKFNKNVTIPAMKSLETVGDGSTQESRCNVMWLIAANKAIITEEVLLDGISHRMMM